MNEWRGDLARSGRVTRQFVERLPGGLNDPIFARISMHETRYNLRRVFVSRVWRVTMLDCNCRFESTTTRQRAIDAALQHEEDGCPQEALDG